MGTSSSTLAHHLDTIANRTSSYFKHSGRLCRCTGGFQVDCIKVLLADGVATLDTIEIHGPSDQLEIVKPGTEALGTKYFAIDSGFSKFV